MSIEKFLDISTGHLPVKDRERLGALTNRTLPFRVFTHEYGWNVWLNGDDERLEHNIEALEEVYGLTDALGHVLRYAKHHECWMVNFDRDAERIEGLAYWDE